MYLPEGDIRWETRLSGRAYIVLARRAEDGCLELGVTSHDGRDRPLTQLSGHIPSRDRQVVARLLATALEFERRWPRPEKTVTSGISRTGRP